MSNMTAEATTEVLQTFAEARNRHDVDALMSLMTDDCVFETSVGPDACGTRYAGRTAVRAGFAEIWATFPDAHWDNTRHVLRGDRGVSEWTFTGTRKDSTRVQVSGCDLFTFHDDKIALTRSYRKIRSPQQADGYVWKLRATCGALIFWVIVCIVSLWALVEYQHIFSPRQPWALSALVAALGGLVGGLARALYFFSFDSYAFNHRLETGASSQWARSVCPRLDDQFDPIWVWYLWGLKPAVGAMVGLVFGLAIELVLVSLGAGGAANADINLRLVVFGGIGGFFSEGFFERVRSGMERRKASS